MPSISVTKRKNSGGLHHHTWC